MKIITQLAKSGDFDKFLPLYQDFLEKVDTSHPGLLKNGKDQFADYLNQPQTFILLALSDNELTGFSEFGVKYSRYRDTEPRLELASMFVSSKFRKLGVGRALLEFIEQWGKENNIFRIEFTSGDDLHDAHKFYERLGYNKYGFAFKKIL